MELEFTKMERRVGLFMMAVLLLVVSSVFLLGRAKGWFLDTIDYTTVFEESYNLKSGAQVKLYNTEIGTVKRVRVTGDRVEVKLEILADYAQRIRMDTTATVESPTFIGSEYVAIRTTSKSAAPLIAAGGTIPSVEKKSIGDVLAEFEVEKTARKLVVAVQDLSEMVSELRDPHGPVFQAMGSLNAILADLEKGDGTLGSLLNSREGIEAVLARLDEMGRILASLEKAAQKAPATMEKVNRTLSIVGDATGNVEDGVTEIREVVAILKLGSERLSMILEDAAAGEGNVPEILKASRAGIEEIRSGVRKIDSTVDAIRENPLIRKGVRKTLPGEALDADGR